MLVGFGLHEAAVFGLVALFVYSLHLESRDSLSDGMLWMLAWVLCAADIILSLLPAGEANDALRLYDKLVHFVAYAALVVVFLFAAVWRPRRGAGRWRGASATIVLAVVMLGIVVEIIQGLVGRDAQLLDVVANSIGAILGLMLWRVGIGRSSKGRDPSSARV
ncbi:MAG: VanZ family protein [Actinomycetota bacterium]